VEINAVYLEIDDQTKQTTKIEKIYQKILIT
jgi:calcineurin-like phosphoesterase